jgi:hypothetical protein
MKLTSILQAVAIAAGGFVVGNLVLNMINKPTNG